MVVSVYTTRQQQNEILNLPVTNMECLVFKKFHHNVVVALIYRQSSYKIDLFTENLITLEHKLDRFQGGCIVMGDFNEDIQILFTKIMEERFSSTCESRPQKMGH